MKGLSPWAVVGVLVGLVVLISFVVGNVRGRQYSAEQEEWDRLHPEEAAARKAKAKADYERDLHNPYLGEWERKRKEAEKAERKRNQVCSCGHRGDGYHSCPNVNRYGGTGGNPMGI